MPTIESVGLEAFRQFEPYTRIWLQEGKLLCLGLPDDPVRRIDASDLWRDQREYDVALSMEELEALLPRAARPGPGERGPRLYIPLTLLSEYLATNEVKAPWISRDPSKWMFPFEFEEYGLEVKDGKLVKRAKMG